MLNVLRKILLNDSGQSMVEYAVIVFFSLVTAIFFIWFFTGSLAGFHYNVSSVVCLPVP